MASTGQLNQDGSCDVELFVYDLSQGMAKMMSQQMVGRQIDGIWHTSIVTHGLEVFYGQGISIVKPGTSHHGQPHRTIPMGTTYLDKETFLEYVDGLRERWTAEKYHLLEFNCNNFTDEVAGFLNGSQIPSDIRDLPQDFLSTPLGQSLRPTIDSMFRSAGQGGQPVAGVPSSLSPEPNNSNGQAPQANGTSGMESLLGNVVNSAYGQPNGTPAASSSSSSALASGSSGPIRCTTVPSLDALLTPTSPPLAAMFTDEVGCPPCRMIRPTFDSLAAEYSSNHAPAPFSFTRPPPLIPKPNKKVNFAVIDIRESQALGSKWSVRATPTFMFFGRGGKKEGETKGADAAGLKSEVDLLAFSAYPPHPHAKASLSTLRQLAQNPQPVSYSEAPKFPAALGKLDTFLSASYSDPKCTEDLEFAKKGFRETVVPFLQKSSGPKASTNSTTSSLETETWRRSIVAAFGLRPPEEWFPVLDMLRYGLASSNKETIAAVLLSPKDGEVSEDKGTSIISFILDRASIAMDGPSSSLPKPTFLTLLRLLSNALASNALALPLLSSTSNRTLRAPMTKVLLLGLLSPDTSVRTCAAGLAFGAVGRVFECRADWVDPSNSQAVTALDDEEWEVELASALVEGLDREKSNEDVVHRLGASLGLLTYLSPFHSGIEPLLEVLEAKRVLTECSQGKGKGVVDLLKDVSKLCESHF